MKCVEIGRRMDTFDSHTSANLMSIQFVLLSNICPPAIFKSNERKYLHFFSLSLANVIPPNKPITKIVTSNTKQISLVIINQLTFTNPLKKRQKQFTNRKPFQFEFNVNFFSSYVVHLILSFCYSQISKNRKKPNHQCVKINKQS